VPDLYPSVQGQSDGYHLRDSNHFRAYSRGAYNNLVLTRYNLMCRAGDIQRHMVRSQPLVLSASTAQPLAKSTFYIKRLLVIQHMIYRPGQFRRHRFLGNHDMRLGLLLLIEAFHLWLPNGGQVRRLHKSQGQVTIAIFSIIMPFVFAVTDFLGVNATGIRQVVSSIGKTLNGACLQSNGDT